MADTRFFLLAGSLGRTVAQEARATKGCQFLLQGADTTVVKPLLTVADHSVLNQWLLALRRCPRLLPLSKKLFIVVSDDHYAYYRQWAEDPAQSLGGFPPENIINNGSKLSDRERPGDLADLALGVRETGASGWVFAASADICFPPQTNLQRFFEGAIVSGRDTVAFCSPGGPCSTSLPGCAGLEHETCGANARITRAQLPAAAGADAVTVPLLGLRSASLPSLESFAQSDTRQGAWQALDRFVVHLSESRPLTGVRFPAVFSVRSLRDALYADAFFAHWNNRLVESAHKPKHYNASSDALFSDAETHAHFAPAGLDILSEIADFKFDSAEALVNRSKLAGADITLPKRFTQSQAWSYDKRRPEHPCYTTSSTAYGAKNPKPADMPLMWNGVKGEFTSTFQGMTRDKGLRCFTAMSKVHRAFDEYTHYR